MIGKIFIIMKTMREMLFFFKMMASENSEVQKELSNSHIFGTYWVVIWGSKGLRPEN